VWLSPSQITNIPFAVALIAQAEVDQLPSLAQYGLLGIAVAVLARFMFLTIKRERERSDRMEQKYDEQSQKIIDKYGPSLGEAQEAVKAAMDLIASVPWTQLTELLRDIERDRRRGHES